MPATRGRKNAALLAPKVKDARQDEVDYAYVVGRKPLTVNGKRLAPGVEIPDAETRIPRLDAWVGHGSIRRVRRDELPAPEAPESPEPPAAEEQDGS